VSAITEDGEMGKRMRAELEEKAAKRRAEKAERGD